LWRLSFAAYLCNMNHHLRYRKPLSENRTSQGLACVLSYNAGLLKSWNAPSAEGEPKSSVIGRRLLGIGMRATPLGIILFFLLGSLSRNVIVLDGAMVISLSLSLLGLLALLAGGVMWAWRAPIVWLLMGAVAVGGMGLLIAEFGAINVAILMFVVLAVVTIGGLLLLIAGVRLLLSWRARST
jgi:hypothetical protein